MAPQRYTRTVSSFYICRREDDYVYAMTTYVLTTKSQVVSEASLSIVMVAARDGKHVSREIEGLPHVGR